MRTLQVRALWIGNSYFVGDLSRQQMLRRQAAENCLALSASVKLSTDNELYNNDHVSTTLKKTFILQIFN